MTYYTTPRGAKVFSAGVMNFGGSALWPVVSTMMQNIWTELSRAVTRCAVVVTLLLLVARGGVPRCRLPGAGGDTAPDDPRLDRRPSTRRRRVAAAPVGARRRLADLRLRPGARSGRAASSALRPPFRRLWTFHGRSLLEFPPVVGYGRVYITNFDGRLFAIDAATGKTDWSYTSGRCGWASPALADHLVFETFIGNERVPLAQPRRRGRGVRRAHRTAALAAADRPDRVVAARRRRHRLRRRLERSRLGARRADRPHALDRRARTERSRGRWRSAASGSSSAPTAATSSRSTRATDASSGRSAGHGAIYSSPAVAYGRVYIGSLDGGVYAFGATTGHLLWAHPTGGYVYASPAVWRGPRPRRLVRPPLLCVRRRHRRDPVALRRERTDLRLGDRDRRPRLLLDLQRTHVRARRVATAGRSRRGPTASTRRPSPTRRISTSSGLGRLYALTPD